MSGRKAPLIVAAFLGLYFGAFAVLGAPSDPDATASLRPLVGTALYFASFVISLLSWGKWLVGATCSRFENAFVGRLAMGSAALSLFAGVFGAVGFIGFGHGFVLQLILFVGVVLGQVSGGVCVNDGSNPALAPESREPASRPEKIVLLLFVIFFAAHFVRRFLMAGLLHGGTDPLMYHMLAPRYWVELGRISFAHNHSMTIHASFWEYLFIWPNAILGAPGGRGLIESQYFAQWLHQLAVIGSAIACDSYFKPLIKNRLLVWAGIALALTNRHFFNSSITAKNDFGIVLWTVALALQLRGLKEVERFGHAIAGALFAMIFFGKTVSIFALFMVMGSTLFIWKESAVSARAWIASVTRRLLWMGLGALVVSVPEGIRNALATGNPLPGVFPIQMKPEWASIHLYSFMKATAPRLADPAYFLGQVEELFSGNEFQWAVFLALPLALFFSKRLDSVARRLVALSLWCCAACLLYCAGAYGVRFYRWLGAALLFLPVCSMGLIETIAVAFKSSIVDKIASWIGFVLVLGSIAVSGYRDVVKMNLLQIAREVRYSNPTRDLRVTRTFEGGDSLAWVRMNVSPSALVGSTGDLMLYYVSHLRVAPMTTHPILDRELSKNSFTKDLVKRAHLLGMRYVLDVDHRIKYNYSRYAEIFKFLIESHPEAVAYAGPDSRVIDLDRLTGELFGACLNETEGDVMTRLGVLGWLDSEDLAGSPSLTK